MIRFFTERPIFAGVVSIVITLVGALAILNLPVAQYPEITPPTVQVSATYTGASAEVVEETVATPIEEQVNGAQDMLYMSSISSNDGSMNLTVTFDISRDLDMATVDVQNRAGLAQPQLPSDVTRQGISVKKQSPNILMVINLLSEAGLYDSLFLTNYAKINLADAIARIPGVGSVNVFGAGDYSMRIWLDPAKLATLGLTVSDVANAVSEQNIQAPAGQVGLPPAPPGQQFQYTVRVKGRLSEVEEFKNIIIRANPDGSMVRVRDVADVTLGALTYANFSRLNGNDTTSILVYQLPGANAMDVAKDIRQTVAELSTGFPDGVQYRIPHDTTKFVQASIDEVMETLWIAMALVFIVVFVFLQNWRATLIPMLTVPVSLVGTFAFFIALGFSINTLSLFGIVLAIGLVVDDAIVVVEAVQRIMDEEGASPFNATLKAMKEVAGALVANSLVLIAVFIPVSFMGGISGRLYQQFALTLSVSVAISTLNALTLSPALCALLLRPEKGGRGPLAWFFKGFNRVFDAVTGGYNFWVKLMIRRGLISLIFLAGFTALGLGIMDRLPTGFVPAEDQGYFIASVMLPPAASLQRTDKVVSQVEQFLNKTEGVANVISLGGMNILNSSSSSYTAALFVILDPWDERRRPDLTVDAIIGKTWARFKAMPEAVVAAFNPPPINGLGVNGGFTFELQDRSGASVEELNRVARKFMAAANARPELTGVFTSFDAKVPQIHVDVDRAKAKTLGVPVNEIFTTMQTFLGGYYVNDFNRFGRTYKVMLQSEPEYRARPEQIKNFYVQSSAGDMVPLSTLTRSSETSGPEFVQRFNLYPTVEITGSPAPGYSSGQSLDALEELAATELPAGYGFAWSGMSYQEIEAGGQAVWAFTLAVVMVFLFLAALYESWAIPFSVLLAVPLGVLGAVAGQYLRGLDNNVYAQIGLVMLIGLAAKNAVLIVEFAKMRREQGASTMDAALEAAHLRFRPILMTSFAFILGVVPLVIASGAGSSSRHSLGTSVFFGMITATCLGVLFVPWLYYVVQRMRDRMGKGGNAPQSPDNAGDAQPSDDARL